MKVTFTRTGERRYKITVERSGEPPIAMDFAAGLDVRLPHDATHFLVGNERNIAWEVFAQLAMEGTASSFSIPQNRIF